MGPPNQGGRKRLSGQVEIAVIVAFVLIAVAVVLVSSSGFVADSGQPLVTGKGEEKKLVRDSILSSIGNLAREELKRTYRTGGIAGSQGSGVKYGPEEVGIWGDCEGTEIPDLEGALEEGLERSILGLFERKMVFFGRNVSLDLGKTAVDAAVQENGVRFDVDMPTMVEGSAISQPYSVLIRSRLMDIMDVSEEITKRNHDSRFFESATLNTILHSNPEIEWMPTVDLLTGCGSIFFATEGEMVGSAESLAKYTVSHTVFNRSVLDLPGNPFYVLGLSDSGLEVSFVYPDGWELERNFDVEPDPVLFYPKPVLSFSSACIETLDVGYSLRYPVVVLVEDDRLGEMFRFVLMVNIEGNKPGCGFSKGAGTSYHERCVMEAECAAGVEVRDSEGIPVGGALVTFGECSLGKTDASGRLNSQSPCMVGELSVSREGYGGHESLVKAEDLRDYRVVLEKEGEIIPVCFYGVPMEPGRRMTGKTYEDYSVSGEPKPLDMFTGDYFALAYMKKGSGETVLLNNMMPGGFSGEAQMVMEPGVYDVFGVVVENATGKTVGYAQGTYLSVGDEEGLYLYLPVVGDVGDSLSPSEVYTMEEALGPCGIDAVSAGEQAISVPCG